MVFLRMFLWSTRKQHVLGADPADDGYLCRALAGDSVGSFLTFGGDIYSTRPSSPNPYFRLPGLEHLRKFCRRRKTQYSHPHFAISRQPDDQLLNGSSTVRAARAHLRTPTDLKDGTGHVLVTAYPLQRPDGEWSIMVINKDPVRIRKQCAWSSTMKRAGTTRFQGRSR